MAPGPARSSQPPPTRLPAAASFPRPPPLSHAALFPVALANGSAPLLHKREQAGPGSNDHPCETGTAGDVALSPDAPPFPRALTGWLQRALGAV